MRAPLRPCSPGCPELTRGGRCARCRSKRQRRFDETRGTSAERGYDARWRKVRHGILTAPPSAHRRPDGVIFGHGPLCVFCAVEHSRVTPATEVDHIDGNSRNNAPENLRSACHACHSRRTAVDQGFARRSA